MGKKKKQKSDNTALWVIGSLVTITAIALAVQNTKKENTPYYSQLVGSAGTGNTGAGSSTGASSVSEAKIKNWSDRIYKALHNSWYNEDEEAIYQVGSEICQSYLRLIGGQYFKDYGINMIDDLKEWLSVAEYQEFESRIRC